MYVAKRSTHTQAFYQLLILSFEGYDAQLRLKHPEWLRVKYLTNVFDDESFSITSIGYQLTSPSYVRIFHLFVLLSLFFWQTIFLLSFILLFGSIIHSIDILKDILGNNILLRTMTIYSGTLL